MECMNKKVVLTGTTLSLLKLIQHNSDFFNELTSLLKKTARGSKKHVSKMVLTSTIVCWILLQLYTSKEKSDGWKTLDSFSTIVMIMFEMFAVLIATHFWPGTTKKQIILTQIFHSIMTVFTLSGYNRSTNPGFSVLWTLMIELIVLSMTTKIAPRFLFPVLAIILPFIWDKFEKEKSNSSENEASKGFTAFNSMRIVWLTLMFLLFMYQFLGPGLG